MVQRNHRGGTIYWLGVFSHVCTWPFLKHLRQISQRCWQVNLKSGVVGFPARNYRQKIRRKSWKPMKICQVMPLLLGSDWFVTSIAYGMLYCYVYIHIIYRYIHLYKCICICIHKYVLIPLYLHNTYMYIYVYVYIYVYIHVYIYKYKHTHIYIYTYWYKCIYICRHKFLFISLYLHNTCIYI